MSLMRQEALEAPEVVAHFMARNEGTLRELGARLRALRPPVILTSARGSSDHAAGYHNYLCEILVGVPCASIGASVVSIYGAPLKAKGAACLTISQSGQSPDILRFQQAAKLAGALTIAMINNEDSPAAFEADVFLPLSAGAEKSVAATKTMIASAAGCAAIIAEWQQDQALLRNVRGLPQVLLAASGLQWPEFVERCSTINSLYVLGRGPSLPIAAEIALKLKETCAIHAEAYSTAEVMHGPLELVGQGFNVLSLVPDDAAQENSQAATAKLRAAGATVFEIGPGGLPYARTGHGMLDPISMVLTAYMNIEAIAQARGRNPDRPLHLQKVTETV